MKRGLLALSVVALVVCVCGMAFAAETPNFTPEAPVKEEFVGQIGGVTDAEVVDAGANREEYLSGDQNLAINAILDEGDAPVIAKVTFSFPAGSTTVDFEWKDGQVLFHYTLKVFHNYAQAMALQRNAATAPGAISAMAAGTYQMGEDSPYRDPASAPGTVTFVSVEGASKAETSGSGGGGGCSMLTLGAVALFLLPALALTKRKK